MKKTRKWKWWALSIFVLIVLAISWHYRPLYPAYFRPSNINKPMLISHGGPIDGDTYTNSYEALLRSVKKGYQLIEIDMLLTSDGMILGAHDWEHFNNITGFSGETTHRKIQEAISRKIFNKYTVLTAENIKQVFSDNPSLYLVTDKLNDFDAIIKQLNFPNAAERILVEVFGYKNYRKALKKGIKYPMLCIWNRSSLKKNMDRIRGRKITMITIPVELIEEEPELLEETYSYGVAIFAFTANKPEFIKKHMNKRATGFYTDWIQPDNI